MGVAAAIIGAGVSYDQSSKAKKSAERERAAGEAKLAEDKRKASESAPFSGTKAGNRIGAEKSMIARRAGAGSYAKSTGKSTLG